MTLKKLLTKINDVLKRHKKEEKKEDRPFSNIILHHSVENNGWESVNRGHKERGFPKSDLGFYVGYHYYIDREGRIFRFRREEEQGAHTVGKNDDLGICLMGMGHIKDFTDEQYDSLKRLIKWKFDEYGLTWDDVFGHKDFSNTVCPSDNVYNWLEKNKGQKTN